MENFGLVNWDSVEFRPRGANTAHKRDEFISLQSGSNVLRIVTRPFQYIHHKWKEPGERGYGNKIMCSAYHGSCPLCTKGDKAKRRWYVGVIDRKTQSYKILDMSPAVFQAVQKLTRNELWGDPGNYDIDIVVDKDAGATGYYTIMPMPKSPLSDRDVEIKQKEVDVEALKKRCTPPKPEEVERRLTVIREKINGGANAAATVAVAAAVDTSTDDESDYTFPQAKVDA